MQYSFCFQMVSCFSCGLFSYGIRVIQMAFYSRYSCYSNGIQMLFLCFFHMGFVFYMLVFHMFFADRLVSYGLLVSHGPPFSNVFFVGNSFMFHMVVFLFIWSSFIFHLVFWFHMVVFRMAFFRFSCGRFAYGNISFFICFCGIQFVSYGILHGMCSYDRSLAYNIFPNDILVEGLCSYGIIFADGFHSCFHMAFFLFSHMAFFHFAYGLLS